MDLSKILDATPEPTIRLQDSWLGAGGTVNYNNSDDDYCLPTPMADFQKELTDDIVSLHYSDILKYFETNNKDDLLLIDSLEKLYLNIQLISSHPYLLIDHFMPKSLIAKDIPMKLIQTSGKFKVLKTILDIYSGVQDFRNALKNEIHNQIKHETKDHKGSSATAHATSGSHSYDGQSNKKVNQGIFSSVKKQMAAKTDIPSNKHILIITREGKSLDLVESLILGLKIKYVKYSGSYLRNNQKDQSNNDVEYKKKISTYSINLSSNMKNYINSANFNLSPLYNLTVHLISSTDLEAGGERVAKLTDNFQSIAFFKFDLVIPFDLSVNTKLPVIQTLRSTNYSPRVKQAPILRLVPIYTVEHIALNFNYNNGDGINENFRNTISAVVVERGKVGTIDTNLRNIFNNNLDYLSNWLLYHTDGTRRKSVPENITWPLPPITKIPIYTPQDVEKSLLTEVKYVQEDDYSDFEDEAESKKKSMNNDKLEFDDFNKFKQLYLKTPNDYFYESKRLTSRYMLNPIQIKNRSSIIGIEAESIDFKDSNSKGKRDATADFVANDNSRSTPISTRNAVSATVTRASSYSNIGKSNANSYYDYLTKELILTHFEIYEINLKYLTYKTIEGNIRNSLRLNAAHCQDYARSLEELEKFLQEDQDVRQKYEKLVQKRQLLQKILAQDKVTKLQRLFDKQMITKKERFEDIGEDTHMKDELDTAKDEVIKTVPEDKLAQYKEWEKNQLEILDLLEKKNSAKKSYELKQNELNYLTIELDKLSNLKEENVGLIKTKADLLENQLSKELSEFVDQYNSIDSEKRQVEKSSKRRKMNELISEVDGLMLNIKQEITVNEDLGYNKNRNRYRRK